MIEKVCSKCGNIFEADADWKNKCINCWKKSKGISISNPKKKHPGKNPWFDRQLVYDEGFSAGYTQGYEDRGKEIKPTDGNKARITKAELRELQAVCHPDVHPEGKRRERAEAVFKLLQSLFVVSDDRLRDEPATRSNTDWYARWDL